jgi:molybdenum cofactor biosynthesis enzyme MoaA
MNTQSEFDIRVVLSPPGYCNYRCPFCHQEGIPDARRSRHSYMIEPHEFKDLVLWLKGLGLRGVTLSGAEPLMQVQEIAQLLDKLPPTPITIVTNGRLLSEIFPIVNKWQQCPWRVNINFPSFERNLFYRLTGQTKTGPETILSQLSSAVDMGIEVNLNCVLCPGDNDDANALNSYVDNAKHHHVSFVRFLFQTVASSLDEERVMNALKLPTRFEYRRGGRIKRFSISHQTGIEFVHCESGVTPDINSQRADIYLTTRRTVKLGLLGEEHAFDNLEKLRSIISGYFIGTSVK